MPLAPQPSGKAAAAQEISNQKLFEIPPQPLGPALAEFSRQAGIRVDIDPAMVGSLQSPGIRGTMAPTQALNALLAGTGLVAANAGGVVVLQRPGVAPGPGEGNVAGDPDAIQLDTITVAGSSDPGKTEGSDSYAAPSTNTATKFDLTPRETPQTVQVITQQMMKDFNVTNARRALELTPGVHVEAERNTKSFMYFSRGYELQTQFDGVPSPLRIGDRDTITPDTAILDRIEVLQGPAGLLGGAGAPGGVVNLMRKMPTFERQTSFETNVGSWNTFRFVGDVSGPLNDSGSLRGRLVAVHDQSDGYVEETEGKKAVIYGVLEADLGETTTVTAGADIEVIYDASNGANYGNPMFDDGSDPGFSPRKNLGADWARDDRSSQTYFVKLDQNSSATGFRSR